MVKAKGVEARIGCGLDMTQRSLVTKKAEACMIASSVHLDQCTQLAFQQHKGCSSPERYTSTQPMTGNRQEE